MFLGLLPLGCGCTCIGDFSIWLSSHCFRGNSCVKEAWYSWYYINNKENLVFSSKTPCVCIQNKINEDQYTKLTLHPHQHLLLLILSTLVILVGVQWYHILVFICISLMTNDTEHLTCITSVVIYLLKSFVHFYWVIYLLLLNFEVSSCG